MKSSVDCSLRLDLSVSGCSIQYSASVVVAEIVMPNLYFIFLCRPVPIVLVEYWKVAHYKKKLLKKLPKSGSSPIQFLDVFI